MEVKDFKLGVMESAWYQSSHWGRICSPPFQEILREPQAGQGAVTLRSALTLMRAHKANQLGGPKGMPTASGEISYAFRRFVDGLVCVTV